jgi:hypothetical protein
MLRFGDLIAGCGVGILLCGTEGMAGEQGLRGPPTDLVMTWRQEGPPEGADSLSAVGLRSLQLSRFRVLAKRLSHRADRAALIGRMGDREYSRLVVAIIEDTRFRRMGEH